MVAGNRGRQGLTIALEVGVGAAVVALVGARGEGLMLVGEGRGW